MTSRKDSASAPSRRPATPEDERRLFETEMRGVRPLAQGRGRVVPDWSAPPGPTRPPAQAKQAPPALRLDVDGEKVSGTAFGVARELLRDLANGRFPPEADLNLHHAPADSAVHRIQRFVELSIAQGRRCVLVIHGRGRHSGPSGPVLLSVALEALAKKPLAHLVLAVTTAPAQYGGSGALLLLLRRNANQK